MTTGLFRERLLARLREDLVGPLVADEVLTDRPSQRYSTGILYPRGSRIEAQENEDGSAAVNETEDGSGGDDQASVSLHAALKPSAAGFSFAVRANPGGVSCARMKMCCARYVRFAVNDAGEELKDVQPDRAHERWRRTATLGEVRVELNAGEQRFDHTKHGIEGLELYVLVTPYGGVQTVTAAVSNTRLRGDSSAYDEEQHFFQVELVVDEVVNGAFAPRPSRKAQTDDDSRTAALIYRDVQEYVVGHTASARAVLDSGQVVALRTDWVPAVIVPGVSDRGDVVFDSLRDGGRRPLEAKWLAEANADDLVAATTDLVGAYRKWIAGEEARIATLPVDLQPQARRHLDRCLDGAKRMDGAVALLRADANVRTAFQLAQRAMMTQFGWAPRRGVLVWRPFQLAFQLLVLESLATRGHRDRDTMDLLWFPTGGGKTEAYLALTAFVILLRRLRGTSADDGAGVAVLMRYTLRLLTVQQFQRAAAMIFACELLRRLGTKRSSGVPPLGARPIGIGLWVGAAATPLTLKDALNRAPGDPSTPEQLTACPCCGSKLDWKLTPRESTVECSSAGNGCELAQTGARLLMGATRTA